MSIVEKEKETAALIVSKPPLHRRVEMYLLYDGFFSFAVVRQNISYNSPYLSDRYLFRLIL